MIRTDCEACGKTNPPDENGRLHLVDYCIRCSRDLCAACLASGKCRKSTDGKHKASASIPDSED